MATATTRHALGLGAGTVAAVLALLAAGCGGSASPQVASIGAGTAPAVKRSWAGVYHCYASHGYPDYRPIGSPSVPGAPPIRGWYRQPNGNYAITSAYSKFQTAQFTAVDRLCEPFFPGKRETPAQATRDVAQMLKFAQCARAHGMRNLPDPDSGGLIPLTLADYESPLFQRAENACKSLLKYGELFGIRFPPGWTPTNPGGS